MAIIILFVIAILLLLVLTMSVGVRVKYEDSLMIWVKVGLINAQVYPIKPKKKTEKPKSKAKKKPSSKPEKGKKKYSAAEVKSLIVDLLPYIKKAISIMGDALIIDFLQFHLVVGAATPSKTAERYGKATAAVFTAVPVLENMLHIKRRDIKIGFDYGIKSSKVGGEIVAKVRVYSGLAMLTRVGIPALKRVLKFTKSGTIVPIDSSSDDKTKQNTDNNVA